MKFLQDKLEELLKIPAFKQLIRFLITGTIATLISTAVFLMSLKIFGIHYLISNLLSFIVSFSFNYILNKNWSFENKEKKLSNIIKYLSLYLTSLLLSSVILKVSVETFGLIPEIGFIISLCFTTIFNFSGLKFFVFKN